MLASRRVLGITHRTERLPTSSTAPDLEPSADKFSSLRTIGVRNRFYPLLLGCITHENNRKQRSLELRSSFLSPSKDYSRAWISLQVKGTYFLLTCPNSFLKMKTPKQIEKTRILETVKLLTNLGRHQEASKLFNQHFGV